MRRVALFVLAFLLASAVNAQRVTTVGRLGACNAQVKALQPMAIVVDGNSATDLATGGGSTLVIGLCNGSSWAATPTTGLTVGAASSIDSQIALFSSTTGKVLKTAGAATIGADPAFVASQVGMGTTGFIFEGLTADTIEGLLTVADPTSSDKTWTIPNATGAFMLSGGLPDAASGLFQGGTDLKYEGTTADDFESMIRFASDPTADAIAVIPAATGFMVLSDTDLQGVGAIWGTTNGIVHEGTTANDFETTVTATDPTADRAIAYPDAGGTVALYNGQPQTATGSAAAGAANVTEVTITVKDGAGATVAAVNHMDVWLSDAATCEGLTGTSASGTVQAKAASGTDLQVYSAKKAIRVQSLATGVYILQITDTFKTLFKVCAAVNGKATLIDTLQTADYGV